MFIMALVERSMSDRIGILQMNRPEKHNCLNGELMRQMMQGLDALVHDEARAIVIRAAAGAGVWSAGHDINEIPEPRRDPLGYFDALETLLRNVQDCPVPVIAMVDDDDFDELLPAVRQAGFAGVVTKPINPRELASLLQQFSRSD